MPVVAVVGRPNVGKSTLVNRLLGRREAIVEERPGVTRDRKVVEVEWGGRRFSVVDTGGWSARGGGIDEKVSRQAERAWREADVVLLVIDASVGVTGEDREVAAKVRTGRAPVLVVANKVDSEAREADAWELVQLGLGDPLPVSALHGRRAGDLLDEVVQHLPADEAPEGEAEEPSRPKVPAVAIVGRPNVGKSTLFNRLIGDDRSVVHDLPGTTRDTVDTEVETDLGRVRFLDTAGMRRKARIDESTEYYSVVRALQAVDVADVALLVLDAGDGVTAQDQRLAERVVAAGSPIVVVLNKWDGLDTDGRAAAKASVGDRLAFLPESPVVPVSAVSGKGVHKLLPALGAALDTYQQRVPTRELNQVLQRAQAETPSPGGRVLYATQGATEPPTFTLFATRTIPPTYLRYLERRIREHFGFGNAPLKLRVRRRSD
ncbi:MAG TPA: ribosome biogenesis GTPase Der [Acidimicrobiales bacterium]|nr:ribosome biogenesis GTPase Der [Acidimicrobiales bacterium]